MISDALYTVNQRVSTTTDLIESAVITDPAIVPYNGDIMAPYYMGYVTEADGPSCMMAQKIYLLDETLFIQRLHQNHAWGFCTTGYSANNIVVPAFALYDDGNNSRNLKFRSSTESSKWVRFINYIQMSKFTCRNYLGIGIRWTSVRTANIDSRGSCVGTVANSVHGVYTQSKYLTFQQWEDFLAGDYQIPILNHQSLGSGADRRYFTVNASYTDFDETGTATYLDENDDDLYTVYVQMFAARPYFVGKYGVTGAVEEVGISPFFSYEIPETANLPAQRIMTNMGLRQESGYINMAFVKNSAEYRFTSIINNWTDQDSDWLDEITFGKYNLPNTFRLEDFQIPSDLSISYGGIIFGSTIVKKDVHTASSDSMFIYNCIHPDDVTKVMNFWNKIDLLSGNTYASISPSNTYTTDNSTALFNDDNTPKNQRAVEDLSTLEPSLRDWQLPGEAITDNDFEYDDMPQYDPEGGDETKDKFSGDNIFFNLGDIGSTSGFITHWALTSGNITNFGNYIWTNLLNFDTTDPDNPVPLAGVWQNIKIAANTYFTTGSVDPASLMQLIIGLRYYPFDLTNFSAESSDDCVYFGTGQYGVPVTGGAKTRVISKMAIHLNGGFIMIPETSDFWYKDFRDFEGASAFIYIPFCGTYQIPISEVDYNTQFNIDYEIDLASGSMTAYVRAIHMNSGKTYPIIIANGQCGYEVPLSATNANRLNATIIGDAQKVIGAIVEPVNSAMNKVQSGVTSAVTMGLSQSGASEEAADNGFGGGSGGGLATSVFGFGPGMVAEGASGIANVATGMATRPACGMPLLQGGRGWSGLAGPLTPYLQLRRGRYMYAKGYQHSVGRPENRNKRIGNIKGYFECNNVDMTGVTATVAETNMIKRMLETGVYRK